VLVARERLSEREAFERLRRQARDQRRSVAEVAAEVMASTDRPARDGGKHGPVGQSDELSTDPLAVIEAPSLKFDRTWPILEKP